MKRKEKGKCTNQKGRTEQRQEEGGEERNKTNKAEKGEERERKRWMLNGAS